MKADMSQNIQKTDTNNLLSTMSCEACLFQHTVKFFCEEKHAFVLNRAQKVSDKLENAIVYVCTLHILVYV